MADSFQPDSSDSFAPDQSFGNAVREYGHKMNPVAMAQGIAENVMHPGEAIKRWGQVNNKILSNAEDAYKRGDYTEAAAHALYYVLNGVPGLGESLDEAGTKIRNGDIAGGLADTAALGTQVAAGIKAPAIAEALPKVPTAAVGAVKGAAQDAFSPVRYGHYGLPVPNVAAGAMAGHYLGRALGAPEAGAVAGAAYPVIRGAIRGAKSALAAPEAATASSAAATTGAAAAETLADGATTVQDIGKGLGIKNWKTATPEAKATAQETFDRLKAAEQGQGATPSAGAPQAYTPRPPDYYGVKAAEVPPQPAQSAPAPTQPASAAPTPKVQPIRPEPPPVVKENSVAPESSGSQPKPASGATAAKSARYADAIAKWAKDMGMTPKDIADQWGTTTPEVRGQILLELKRKGYLGANETIPRTSAQGIVDALKAKAATIKPPAGFGMGSMGTTQ